VSARALTHPLLGDCGVEHGFGVRDAPSPPDLARPVQVHGAEIATREACARERCEADGVVATGPGERVGIVTADCAPLLLATEDGRAVAAVHAGWRGLAAGVVRNGVAALRAAAGGSSLVCAIGPHIGPCCYEVDAPVLTALRLHFGAALDEAAGPARAGHAMLDLGALARAALLAAGLSEGRVGSLPDACTHCDASRFHSYRRDGPRAGRLVHFVAPRAAEREA
jgi:hypothetical protein